MQIKLGEKIKELRCRDGRTQEALADALGVTGQAVSRWETNGGYPDIEIIPVIANYFNISIDELFGYNGEREEKIRKILNEADEMINTQHDMKSCIDMLRDAVSEFPSEAQIILRLGYALLWHGYKKHGARRLSTNEKYAVNDIDYNSKNEYFTEALAFFQRALSLGINQEDRCEIIPLMVRHYAIMGNYVKAEELCDKQNSIVISCECLRPNAAEGMKREKYQEEALRVLTRQMYRIMETMVWTNMSLYMNESGVQKMLGIARLYELIFDDSNFGEYHADLMHIYKTCTSFEAKVGNFETALCYFERQFHHAKKYEEFRRNDTDKVTRNKFPIAPVNILNSLLNNLPENFIEAIKKNHRYAECFSSDTMV